MAVTSSKPSVVPRAPARARDGTPALNGHIDPVTGLGDRRAICARIDELLVAEGCAGTVVVFSVDLDRFQVVNDHLGHEAGDLVLALIGHRLSELSGPDNVARLGGDEFVVVGSCVGGEAEAVATASRLRTAVAEPISLLDQPIQLTATVGVAIGSGSSSASALIQRADIALHRGRAHGRPIDIADLADAEAAQESLQLEQRLRDAVRNGGLDVAFQLLFDPAGRAFGVEALVRWPDAGVNAGTIIEVAERSSLILQLGDVVVDKALSHVEELSRMAGRPLRLSVNWSNEQLGQPDAAERVAALLERHGVPAEQLCIELTESAAMVEGTTGVRTLQQLRELGVAVSLDDFGTGYSSFAYLRDLPIDEVKLDRAFVTSAVEDPRGADILEGMVRLCRGLGLQVVGEGVETEEELDIALRAGCTAWQGFLGGPPSDVETVARQLQVRREEAERDDASDLGAAMASVGLADLLVFKRIGEARFAHIGGRGRGEGWAGIVEVDLAAEPVLAQLLRRDGRALQCDHRAFQVIGPYYATSAAVMALGDKLVVVGHPTETLDDVEVGAALDHIARLAVHEIVSVSPTKPLADELEVLEAVQALLRFSGPGMQAAMAHMLTVIRRALSCEVGFAWKPEVGVIAQGLDVDDEVAVGVGAMLQGRPRCEQHAQPDQLPGDLVERADIRSFYAIPLNADAGVVLLAHTGEGPRGFTSLCQRLGRTLVESSEVLFSSALAHERLQQEATRAASEARTDGLTGLPNRKAWDEEVAEVEADTRPVGVIMLDTNRFKLLNDTHGHPVGDQVLREIAARLSALFASDGFVARLGGDEFGVMLVGATEALTEQVACSCRDALVVPVGDHEEAATVAVGSAWVAHGEQVQGALVAADAAMYAEKDVRR